MNPFIQLKTIVVVSVLLAWAGIAGAQSFPRLKPLPPKKDATVLKASPALAPDSPWQLLPSQPPVLDYTDCGPGNPILLTDGTVMLADNGCQDWWKLTPDEFGSYVNGTWTQLASLPDGYSPLYHASAVLPDGRVIIEGGEYNFSNGVFHAIWTDQGAIYDPVANTWTLVAPPPFFGGFGPFPRTIGDAQSVVLFDGTFMLANALTRDTALLDANTLTWTQTGKNKFDVHDEEGWTLLPNKKVLTVDAYVFVYRWRRHELGNLQPQLGQVVQCRQSQLCSSGTPLQRVAGGTMLLSKWDPASCGPMAQSSTLERMVAVRAILPSITRTPDSGRLVRIFRTP